MNDVERYELAEKIVEMYQESGGVFSEETAAKYFGDVEEPSAEDQEIIFNIARDLIKHGQDESDTNANEEDSDESTEELGSQSNHYSLKAETIYHGADAQSI